jgi:hypothetical protein
VMQIMGEGFAALVFCSGHEFPPLVHFHEKECLVGKVNSAF